MTIVAVEPDATVSNTGVVTGAGGDLDAALRDELDTTYVTLDAFEGAKVGVGGFSLPAGAQITTVRAFAKVKKSGSASALLAYDMTVPTDSKTVSKTGTRTITWSTFTSVVLATLLDVEQPISTDTQVNAATIEIGCLSSPTDLVVSEVGLYVTYVTTPTLNVYAPTGTLDETNIATVSWTPTLDSSGGPQTQYEVKMFDSATYGGGGFDPDSSEPIAETGIVSGSAAGSRTLPTALPDDDYRAYVRIWQTIEAGGNDSSHSSDWDYSAFTVEVDKPAVPDLVLAVGDGTTVTECYVAAEVTENAGDVDADWFEIERSDDGGESWTFVRTSNVDGTVSLDGDSGGTVDYEVSNGQTDVVYRARAVHDFGGGLITASDWVEETTDSWTSSLWLLKHPVFPQHSVALDVYSRGERSRAGRTGVFQAKGARYPVALNDTRASWSGSLVVNVETVSAGAALDAVIDSGVALLLQAPPEHHWRDKWVSIGDQGRVEFVDKLVVEDTLDTLPWTEVARPSNEQLRALFPALDLLPAPELFPE